MATRRYLRARRTPAWVYHTYRALSESHTWVERVQRDVDIEVLRDHAEDLALSGADEDKFSLVINGEVVGESGQLAAISREDLDPDTTVALARVAHARLGSIVRSIATATTRGVIPLANQRCTALVLADLGRQLSDAVDTHVSEPTTQKYLHRVHSVMVEHEVDLEKLDALSVRDILKLRSQAWGRANIARNDFLRAVRKLALECDGDEEFDSRIRAEVTRFDEMSAGYRNERRKLVKLSCRVGLSGLMQAVINTAMTATGDVSMAVTLIAAAVGTLGGLSQMDVSQFIDMRQEYHASNAYAVGSVYDYARKR